jgi:agmatine deiminase
MKEQVFIAAHLPFDKKGYAESVYNELKKTDKIDLVEIQNHNTYVWCRDYMPVKSSTGKYVQFTFAPPYLTEAKTWKKRIPDTDKIHQELKLDCVKSEIILDGGAIEVHGKKAIVSDRVFRDNKHLSFREIIEKIKKVLELEQLIIIPQYPGDYTGHVDGLVRFVDENNVVVNDLDEELAAIENDKNHYHKKLIENWVYTFKSTLINAGLELHSLPFAVPKKDDKLQNDGIYTNFLLLDNLIIMPAYDNDKDEEAAQKLGTLYKRPVKQIYASLLANEGGMINCITWTK